ncbi:flagellar export chaperone FliS [bacterium]|nr:flagellar export chaperone FliS [bacterium]
MNPYLKQYQKNEVETASPEKILILLYDGAIQFLNKAKIAMEQKNIPEIHNNIIGCENIILEFINTVDEENGGDFAVRIKALYQYFYNTLVQANMKKDVTKIDEVLRHLIELRATWKQAIAMVNSQKSVVAAGVEDSNYEG